MGEIVNHVYLLNEIPKFFHSEDQRIWFSPKNVWFKTAVHVTNSPKHNTSKVLSSGKFMIMMDYCRKLFCRACLRVCVYIYSKQ